MTGFFISRGPTYALRLEILADKSVEHTGVGQRRVALDARLLQHPLEEVASLVGVELLGGRELLAQNLLQGGDHVDTSPGSLPVDLVLLTLDSVVLGLVGAVDVLDKARDELLGHVHEVVDIGVGHIELKSGELCVSVSRRKVRRNGCNTYQGCGSSPCSRYGTDVPSRTHG